MVKEMQDKGSWSSSDSSHLQMMIVNPCRLLILSMEIGQVKEVQKTCALCDQTGPGCVFKVALSIVLR